MVIQAGVLIFDRYKPMLIKELRTLTRYLRLTQIVEQLGGSISLSCLKRYCDEGRVEYCMSLGKGVRYMTQEQVDQLFLTIKKEVD